MFKGMTDKQKAQWLRDNLNTFWGERFPEATLNGQLSDLLIDIEQQLQLEAVSTALPKAVTPQPVVTVPDLRPLEAKVTSLEAKLLAIPLHTEKPAIIADNSEQLEALGSKIESVSAELVKFKKMTLGQRVKWLVLGE